MAWIEKPNVDTTINMPGGVPTYPKISSLIKTIMRSAQFYFHESEPFEVKEVFLYTHEDRKKFRKTWKSEDWVPDTATTVTPEFIGSVKGTFINNSTQEVKGGYVKPLNPEKMHYPLVGEHVSVIEYNGQHYYKEIINLKNSPNENAAPGATPGYEKNTKYGETFERQDIRRVKVCEGEIVYEGRFGNSIKLGCNHKNNSPIIKIRAGQQKLDSEINNLSKERVNENIDKDSSSIYLVSDGMQFHGGSGGFDGEQINGKKILIKSDGIFISGRDNIRLISVNNVSLKSKEISLNSEKINLNSDDVNLGNEANEPVVKGDTLVDLLNEIIDLLDEVVKTAPVTGIVLGITNPLLATGVNLLKPRIKSILSTKVKTG